MDDNLRLTIGSSDPAEGNELCDELSDWLARDVPALEVTRVREDPNTQDLGVTLVALLGTAAAQLIAKGIADWLASRREAKLRLTRTDGSGQLVSIEVSGGIGAGARDAIERFLEATPSAKA